MNLAEMPVYIGLHIPKCAGTSLAQMVKRALPAEQVYINTSMFENYQLNRQEFPALRHVYPLRFMFGHTVHEEMIRYLDKPVTLFTGLREPIARLKSYFAFRMYLADIQQVQRPTIDELMAETHNPVCQFIVDRFPLFAGWEGTLAERAMKVLKRFDLVYFSETFEADIQPLLDALEISSDVLRENKKAVDVPPCEFDEKRIAEDVRLYEMAKGHFSKESSGLKGVSNPYVQQFQQEVPDVKKLQNFFWEVSGDEYKSYGELDQVIAKKRREIDLLKQEIRFYKKRFKPPFSLVGAG